MIKRTESPFECVSEFRLHFISRFQVSGFRCIKRGADRVVF
jgi:hypothetical protein